MNQISCQACKGKPKKDGCSSCGGYKYLIEQVKTKCCNKVYWTRPGCYTAYQGKRVVSFDGLEMRWSEAKGLMCIPCFVAAKEKEE